MLRRAEDFYDEGSKVFHRAPVNRQSVQGWIGTARARLPTPNAWRIQPQPD